MPIAADGQGNYLTLGADGAWAPATVAQHPDGSKLVLDGGAWKPLPGEAPAGEHGYAPAPPDLKPAQSAAEPTSSAVDDYGRPVIQPKLTGLGAEDKRALGLGVRDVAEGAAALPGALLDAATWPSRAIQRAGGVPTTAPSDLVHEGLTAAGLPQAETPGEQMRSGAIQAGTAALTTAGAGAIPGVIRAAPLLANGLMAAVPAQVAGGLAGGAAQEATRQAGGGPALQFGASMLGGGIGAAGFQAAKPGLRLLAGYDPVPNTLTPQRPAFVSERMAPPADPGATPLDRMTQLIQHDNTETAGASANVNLPGDTRGVGAAASREGSPPGSFELTPQQVQAYRSTAEGQKLLETQQPGIADNTSYVRGVSPNAAEIEQTVNTARELKSLNVTAPDVSQEAKDIADLNNTARRQHFEQTAGSDVSVANAKAARAATAESDLTATWANKSPADAQPVIDAANRIKASPDGRRPLVRSALDSVTNELTDENGALLTDPEQLYGVRKHIDDLVSREAGAADPKSVRAMASLQQIKQTLDGVIEAAAPGFRQYLTNFAGASRPINAMEALQKFEPKLYDAQNRMQYSRVQNMMRQIVDSRSAPGLNALKSIPEETMQRLWALRDDLRRSASAQELARTPGADTAQNSWDIAKGIGGQAALHVGANLVAPVMGSVALGFIKQAAEPHFAARRLAKDTTRGMQMLHPPRNDLTP